MLKGGIHHNGTFLRNNDATIWLYEVVRKHTSMSVCHVTGASAKNSSHTFAACDLWPSAGWRPRGAPERVERDPRPAEGRESAPAASLFH